MISIKNQTNTFYKKHNKQYKENITCYHKKMSSKFIKLTHMILNTNYINKILIYQDLYYIYLKRQDLKGFLFVGSGACESKDEEIKICAKNHSTDYKIISDWIDKEFKKV